MINFINAHSMILNLIAFNFSWFGLVYFGNNFIPIALLLLVIHCDFFVKNSGELLLIMSITMIGIAVDSLLIHFNIFIFTGSNLMPLWLIVLWACFATTICHSLLFLKGSILLQLLVGGIFSPLSYVAGYKLDAVNFGYSLTSTYLLLALVWGLLFVIFFVLKNRLLKEEVSYV